ncbi:glycosyltransferase [Roseivirga sp. BDSF3-8]|uniref:glycosyltransferase n=1 Tax=Roseivirga sp. BDSF3-8 TaxID=3241598 RepID=UPI0035324043
MRVLEIVNSVPGETFIREHAQAIVSHTDIELMWGAWQTTSTGNLPSPVAGLKTVEALPNYNRMKVGGKLRQKVSYFLKKFKNPSPQDIVRETVAKFQPDLIHFQFASLAAQHHQWASDLSIPYTFSVRGSDVQVEPLNNPLYLKSLISAANHAAGIHLVCGQLGKLLEGYAGKTLPMSVVRTSLNPAWEKVARKPVDGKIVSVGRLHWRKDFPTLVLAAKKLKEVGKQFEIHIFGDGPAQEQLEFMIRSMELEDFVLLRGKITHEALKKEFESASIYVQTSIAEGFPNAVGEAMLANIPVVSTICGGVDEVLTHRRNAMLALPGQAKEIAQHIAYLMDNPDFCIEISQSANKSALEHFNSRKHARKFELFWKKALS